MTKALEEQVFDHMVDTIKEALDDPRFLKMTNVETTNVILNAASFIGASVLAMFPLGQREIVAKRMMDSMLTAARREGGSLGTLVRTDKGNPGD